MYDIGTEVYGFKYENVSGRSFQYMHSMSRFIGEVGTVVSSSKSVTSLKFATENRYAYPTSMIEANLVDKGPEIDLKELLTQIKSL
jgi:hypothetical protein